MKRIRPGALAWLAALLTAVALAACETPGAALPPAESQIGDPDRGGALLTAYGCGSCHIIPGLSRADGVVGPPLTHWGRRMYIAGAIPNNFENLQVWIRNPDEIEPGTAMPDLGVSLLDARDMAAYLFTLE